jgi:hypothetical protein
MKALPLVSLSLVLAFCACDKPNLVASSPTASAPALAQAPVTGPVDAAAANVANSVSSASAMPAVKAGFVAVSGATPWSMSVRYHAELADASRVSRSGKNEPREMVIDFARAEDGERLLLRIQMTDNPVRKYTFSCNAKSCDSPFEAQVYQAHSK